MKVVAYKTIMSNNKKQYYIKRGGEIIGDIRWDSQHKEYVFYKTYKYPIFLRYSENGTYPMTKEKHKCEEEIKKVLDEFNLMELL